MSDDAPDSLTVDLCVRKLKDAKATDAVDAHLLEWLAEHSPSCFIEALQIVEVLTSCWEKCGGLEMFSIQTAVSMLRGAQRLLLQSQESSQLLASVLVLALKIQSWCDGSLRSSKEPSQTIPKTQNVLLETLKLANGLFMNLEKCSFLEDKEFRNGAEIYICQFLDSFKIVCNFFQKNQLHDEFQKVAQEALSEAFKVLMKLRVKFIAACGERSFSSLDGITLERAHIIWYGVSAVMDIGKFSARNGRDWVGMLNVAWKGVTALLQTMTRKDVISRILDIQLIINTMIGCMKESLKNAAESWNAVVQEKDDNVNVAELKRLCIPVKFFLINVIRVVTHYPYQAVDAFNDIVESALRIISLRLEISECPRLKFVAEAIVEILEPSLFILFCTLLNSSELEFQVKLQLLNGLFGTNNEEGFILSNNVDKRELDKVNEEDVKICFGQEVNLGRLILFLGLLQSCQHCGDKMSHELAKRLDFPLQMICKAEIYAKVFEPQVSRTQLTAKVTWQPLYIILLKTLQMFFVALAETEAWTEAEDFLYRNVLHPHMLSRELILELWCFISRHSESSIVKEHIQDLLYALSGLLESSTATCSDWPVRTITRLICLLIKADPAYLATQVYELAFGTDPFATTPTLKLASALLKEHFPISILPEELKSQVILSAKRALSEYWSQGTKNAKEASEKLQQFDVTLCCLMECLYQESYEQCIDTEKLHDLTKMIIELLQECHRKSGFGIKSQSLKYLSGIWQKMQPEEIGSVIVPLHNLIVTCKLSESEQMRVKLGLAEALAGLGEVSMPEDNTDPTNCALWELYHVILRERHWAYAHLGLASFGYFVAHTSWNELWRFVPSDAALAHDGKTGKIAKESTFMTSLRCFLEKEVVCTTFTESDTKAVQQEGELLEAALLEFDQVADKSHTMEVQGIVDYNHMDVDLGVHTGPLESSIPPEISNAMSMLQEGLLLLKEKLPTWFQESGQNLEQQRHMHDQLSLLADVIGQFHVLQPIVSRAMHE
ncbi:hypothetical protein GOP47_0013899 [Adiantum capillus-veneris]|uniref:Uncharacterized protein n=1 Tax=Adiantum capillus-veneris TaxID=13818 RepID=A0A9D4ZDN6_ADICA|nr:hypothetical protein GOP47_0013899 [Adiantum capillus-veneris]